MALVSIPRGLSSKPNYDPLKAGDYQYCGPFMRVIGCLYIYICIHRVIQGRRGDSCEQCLHEVMSCHVRPKY